MLTKKDRPSNSNFGYTFKSWTYRPNTDKMTYINNNGSSKSKVGEKPRRSGIIFIQRNEDAGKIKFLVVRGKESGIWSFPKGTIDNNESDEVCAVREVYEETGIVINDNELNKKAKCRIGRNTYFILEVYNEEKYNSFDIKDKFEVDLVEWKYLSELKSLSCNKDIRNILCYPEKNSLIYT